MNDNELLDSFFQSARQQQISDNGFSDRVMERLQEVQMQQVRASRLSRLWTIFCVLFAAVLFFRFVGWQTLLTDIVVFITTIPVNYDLATILLSLLVVGWLGIAEVVRRARIYF